MENDGLVCYLCQTPAIHRLYAALLKIWVCSNCGLVFHYPQPGLEFLKEHYGEGYFISRSSAEIGYDNYLRDEENIRASFRKRFRYVAPLFPKPGRLLDVGCAAGFFLSEAAKGGWNAEGIEISSFMAQYARRSGLRVFEGALEEYPECIDAVFDMVTAWDVFEHFRDPRKDLEKIFHLLKPGGYLAMTTPAIDSLPHFLFRERWMGFKEEEHLFFFSKKTITTLLVQCGFRVRCMKFEGKYVSLDLFKRRIGCYWKGLSDYLRRSLPASWGRNKNFYVNPMDIRLVIAQKI